MKKWGGGGGKSFTHAEGGGGAKSVGSVGTVYVVMVCDISQIN